MFKAGLIGHWLEASGPINVIESFFLLRENNNGSFSKVIAQWANFRAKMAFLTKMLWFIRGIKLKKLNVR